MEENTQLNIVKYAQQYAQIINHTNTQNNRFWLNGVAIIIAARAQSKSTPFGSADGLQLKQKQLRIDGEQ